MSDVSVKEATRQDGLARAYKDYLTAVISFIVGLAVFMYGNGNSSFYTSKPHMIIGWLIMGWPIFFGVFMTKKFDTVFPSYKVVTTYSDGSKESDHGAESSAAWLIGQVICFLLSGVIAFFRIGWLTIKTIAYYIGVKEKPSLLLSPFPVLALFLVGSVLALVIPTKIIRAQMNAIAFDEPEIVQGSILIVEDHLQSNVYTLTAEPNNATKIGEELKTGDTLTATGPRQGAYIPVVAQDGTTGWVYGDFVIVDMPVLATAIPKADRTQLYSHASTKKRYEFITANKDDTLKIIGEEKKGLIPIEITRQALGARVMNVMRLFVKPADITIQGGN